MRMPSSSLHWSCDSLVRSVFLPSCWFFSAHEVLPAIFFPSPPPPLLFPYGLLFLCCCCSLFSPLVFYSVTGACSFPFVRGSWLGCAVVSIMGALFQSRDWLPIVEAPRYSRHPTSILAMQLKLHFILSMSNLLVRWLFQATDILQIKTVGAI